MSNLLLENPDYHIQKTSWGTWLRYLYPTGAGYAEFISDIHIQGWPLFHFTRGICPETGARKTAKGVIAVGRKAIGILAIGQAAGGIIAIGQLAVGVLLGLGQATFGLVAVGQAAISLCFGLGQVATGYVAIGQIALGSFALGQFAFGRHVIMPGQVDPEAVKFFQPLWTTIREFLSS